MKAGKTDTRKGRTKLLIQLVSRCKDLDKLAVWFVIFGVKQCGNNKREVAEILNNFFTSFGNTEQSISGVKSTPNLSHIQLNT